MEALDQRDENQTVFAEPNGTMTAELSVRPVWVKQGTNWVKPDTSLVRRTDGNLSPCATSAEIELSGGGSGPLVRFAKDGRAVTL
ncbi:hypothetical protein GCM10029964_080230 [Kibdelosporangium lantanae]